MKVATTFKNIKANYPEAYASVMKQIRASRSKFKALAPSKFKWSFEVAQQCEAYSFQEVLDGHAQTDNKERNLIIWVAATTPKGAWWAERITVVPQEVKDHYTAMDSATEAEDLRFNALTPEQQQEEIDGLLQELGSMGGFMAVHVPVGKK